MERFIIQKGKFGESQWICKDSESGLICGFEQGRISETKIFTQSKVFGNKENLEHSAEKMIEWLIENHKNLIQ